ncbi:GHMP kinase (plasmid) [Azospirillum humicireducens]|uniref:GHMP kinase n=1 Tax=Azospirillum humicireducens TaxID=1226968 RepID=A0A2R4VRJ8_9PROT|nr:beta-ribofuranosylaminobenzene 5'-phosphate synthase family protein [Azospirillum humicireducens]AWB07068.1 GHMP kinase [Azospirillum humicireducens]
MICGEQRKTVDAVRVEVPARLHLGFLDMEGGLGRRFGSLGLTLDGLGTELTLARGDSAGDGPDHKADRARGYLDRLCDALALKDRYSLRFGRTIPSHSGLGSGTQLALAVGAALSAMTGRPLPPRRVASLLDRGARSGIGVGAFEQGGVILDGGKGALDEPPPVISRMALPEAWRMLLVFDDANRGLSGTAETVAFRDLPPFPADKAAYLCRLALMVGLPALAEEDAVRFGAAVTELQSVVGDHFAPAQGGRFSSPDVAEVLRWLPLAGAAGVGQSSWGPTGFAIFGDAGSAERAAEDAQARWRTRTNLRFVVCRGRNHGAVVETMSGRGAVASGYETVAKKTA